MGLILTLLLSIVFGVMGAVRPRVAFFVILALFAFFDEQGFGFSSYQGSFVFNANFVGLFGLRLIEALIVSTYIPFLLFYKKSDKKSDDASSPFRAERAMAIMFLSMIVVLGLVEYSLAGRFEWRGFRLTITGMMLFHMLVSLFKSEEDIGSLCKVFLMMLALRATYGLIMWAAGRGDVTFRGVLPFFWDSKQVEVYGLAAVVLVAYILNYQGIEKRFRILPIFWAVVMLILMVAAVAGSIRRTVWVTTFMSMFVVMMISRRTTAMHYFAIIFVLAMSLGAVLLAPGLEKFREHMGGYVESMNMFSETERYSNAENSVHINNVTQYTKMLTENPDILLFGVHGPSGIKLKDLRAEYSEEGGPLGQAHNGPIRSVLFFGSAGLLLYLAMVMVTINRTWKILWLAPDGHAMKHIAMGCGIYLLLNFAASFVFVPPFYTTSKGLLYTFLQMFVLGIVVQLLVAKRSRSGTTGSRSAEKRPVPIPSR